MINLLRRLYLTNRFFLGLCIIVLLFVFSYYYQGLFRVIIACFAGFIGITLYEIISLFRIKDGISGHRKLADRLSNGDLNDIEITLENRYPFSIKINIIDEIPEQFQKRDTHWKRSINQGTQHILQYQLRPVKRGEYDFGFLNVYASFLFCLVERRYVLEQQKMIAVYPSILQMKRYEFAAFTHQLSEYGIKKVRRLGHTFEFDQIKEYVRGDDPRTLNWKATARANTLMVNTYQDERSQPLYCIIDKGRMMRFPFAGLSLLDYAINTSLALSNIAIKKHDKAGIITFSNKMSSVVVASKKPHQMTKILEALYNQRTLYKESDFELLSSYVNKRISQRSLLLCFTNFESYSSFLRQLPYFVHLARKHVLIVIFFKNRELTNIIESNPGQPRDVYTQVVAQHYETDKYLIVRKLQSLGIYSILTDPADLTVNTINKYLELKARGVI